MALHQHPATMEKLPTDILLNIFIRLLAKQLAQIRCVSKSWNAFLSQSSFIKSHLQRSNHSNDEILLVFDQAFSFNRKPFTTHPSRSPGIELTNFIKFPVIPQSDDSSLGSVIGSVNGLICFSFKSHREYVVYIWNPSLSAVLTLPPCSFPDSDEVHCGFGFDPKADDYKIVRLNCLLRPPDDMIIEFGFSYVIKEWLQVEVYSTRKGSWHSITGKPPSNVTRIFELDIVFTDGHDGHLHWLGYIDENLTKQTIVAFDLGLETFHEIRFPDSILDDNSYRSNVIGVLAGKICLMSCLRNGDCEVWVMDEYGVAESWIKHHVYSQFSGKIGPFGFTLHNEFLFEAYYNRLVLYDPVAAKSKRFQIMARLLGIRKVVVYVDSLVWVAPPACDINCCSISQLKL